MKRIDFNAFRKYFLGPNLSEAASLSGLPVLLWHLIANSGLGSGCDSAVPSCHQTRPLKRHILISHLEPDSFPHRPYLWEEIPSVSATTMYTYVYYIDSIYISYSIYI